VNWIKWKSHQPEPSSTPTPSHRPQRVSEGIYLPIAVLERIAELLAKHGRFSFTAGRLHLNVVGTICNADGSTDYTVRSVLHKDGNEKVFRSHVRRYATERMRLIR
jgi:hypothetical protein